MGVKMVGKYTFKAVSPDNLEVVKLEVKVPDNFTEIVISDSFAAEENRRIKKSQRLIAILIRSPYRYRYILLCLVLVCLIPSILFHFTKADSYLESLCESAVNDKSRDARLYATRALESAGGTEDFVLEALSKAAIGNISLDKNFSDRKIIKGDAVKNDYIVENAKEAVIILENKGRPALGYLKKVAEKSNYNSVRTLAVWAIGKIIESPETKKKKKEEEFKKYYDLGKKAFEDRHYVEAIENYGKALAIDPSNAEVSYEWRYAACMLDKLGSEDCIKKLVIENL